MGGRVPKVSNPEKEGAGDLSVRIDRVRSGDETRLIRNGSSGEASAMTLSLCFSEISQGLPWFFRKLRRGPGVAPMASQDSCRWRNCVSTSDGSSAGSNRDGSGAENRGASSPGCTRRHRAPGEEQGGGSVSRTGPEDEHHGHGEGGGRRGAERHGERREGSGRAPGA